MIPFEEVKASFSYGKVRMSWKYPPGAPDIVNIYRIALQDGNIILGERNRVITKALRDCTTGLSFDHDGDSGVTFCEYLVFLSNGRDDIPRHMPTIEQLRENGFIAHTPVGDADVSYSIKIRKVGDGMERMEIIVQSSNRIDQGLLGYTFRIGSKLLTAEFPGDILPGKNTYPPIYLPEDSQLCVALVAGDNYGVAIERREIGGGLLTFFEKIKSDIWR